MQSKISAVTTQDLLEAVADQRRRNLLQYLHETGVDVISIEQLADELCARDGSFDDDSDRLCVQLQHVDLPKLADVGVLAFDSRSGAVRYCHDERVGKLLSFVADELQ